MKKTMLLLTAIAASAILYSGCAKPEISNGNQTGNLVTVFFGTENTDPSTKATLTPDAGETVFQADWENEDEIRVKYSNDNGEDGVTGTTTAIWNGKSFESKMPEYTGMWIYDAAYPVPSESDNSVDFGSNRTQKGNAYNSKYDIMIGTAAAENAAAGKDALGKDIVFQMTRQTAIAYFHFTSALDEAVTSATLTVSGEGAAIASNYAYVSDFAWAAAKDCQSITITFPEEAPNAQDFQLWFNVLETPYASMSLTVETATKTFTISKSTDGVYEAGKLYKVKKSGIAWTDKGGSVTPSSVTDVITADKLKATSTTYTDFSGVQISSNAVYAGNNAKTSDGAIQLRSDKSTAGIVTTTSGGKVTKVSIEWASNTTNGRVINVYGNTNPYTSASELYSTTGNTNQGTNLGTIVCGTSTELVIDGNYPYIGIRSNSGALYLNSVSITWETGSSEPAPNTYTVSCATVSGGTLSATPSKAEAGAEITLTATPDEGYAFNDDWTVKDADEAVIPVNEGKFTMPAKDVTVSGSFSKVDYTITKATSEGGSFTVKKNGVEVTKAQIGETITLTASAAEGYKFDSWTVTNESTSKTVYVNENTFTMPGANVTVKAKFVELAVVPVYASLEELVNAGAPTKDGTYVTVTLTNDEITGIYTTSKGYRNGIYFKVGTQEVEIYCQDVPESWGIGGYVSGTLTNCAWKLYYSTWELCPADWTELTYAAPCATPVITLNGAEASITCTTEGATIHYTLDGNDPTETSDIYSNPVPLTEGKTIKAKAFLEGHKASDIASATYSSSVKPVSYEVSGTLASWNFTSSKYPANKTNYDNNGSKDLATGTFYLNGAGSTWNASKGYAFTAVTDITITVTATKALKKGSKITFSMDTYYNKASNAPMKGFNLTAAEGDATASKTGLSVTSFSLSNSSATKSVDYTLQNDVSAGSTVKLILTQTDKAGSGQGYINNIKAEYTAN